MDKEEAIAIATKYAQETAKRFDVTTVIAYGSYISGSPRKDSDIDIAVIVSNVADYLQSSIELNKIVWDIDTRIEPVLFADAERDNPFLQEIIRSGVVVYERQAA